MIKKYVSLVLLKFLIVRGAEVCVMTAGTHYRGLPLVVQGLEIPCNLTATLPGYSTRDHMLLQKYLEIGSDLYVEPTNEEIIGSFQTNSTKQILNSQDLLKQEDLLILSQNHDKDLTSESYFSALKQITEK